MQAVEGPLPVPVLLVGVHDRDGEEQQKLHGQLSSAGRQEGEGREACAWPPRPELTHSRTRLDIPGG